VGEDRTEGAQQGKDYLTVGEAAKLLGVHRNTIHYRIKNGRIKAHKVVEADNEVYRIERNSLDVGRTSADVRPLDAQRTTSSEELSRIIAARLDEIVRELRRKLYGLREMREAPQTVEEQQGRGRQPQSATGGAQEGAQPRSWWRRMLGG
jgi:excisionase family DNA binding protein